MVITHASAIFPVDFLITDGPAITIEVEFMLVAKQRIYLNRVTPDSGRPVEIARVLQPPDGLTPSFIEVRQP